MRVESLFFLALLVLIALLIAAARWILREIERNERRQAEEAALMSGTRTTPAEAVAGEPTADEHQPERRSSRAEHLRTAARWNVLARPTTPHELRRGMVMMTILGTCRGLEPWERSEAAQLGLNHAEDERRQSKE